MKRIIGLFSIGLVFLTSGCFKKDDLEDITIYTSVYPIEYIVDTLYGKNSNVKSIYPDGVDVSKYSLTDKQIKDYSKGNMFIFNGLSDEKDYVTSMFNYNKDLMIIDTTATMEYNNHVEELWLDPSNFLMMSLNVKNGLSEYITNQYLKTEIDNNYNKLKLEISNIDAKIKLLNENSSKKTIVVDNSSFKLNFEGKYTVKHVKLDEIEKNVETIPFGLSSKTKSILRNSLKIKNYIKVIYNKGLEKIQESL